jgi:pyridoxamine 5'-phosphate oxidase
MLSNSQIADIRKDYRLRSLSENEVEKDPIDQFTKWWDEAVTSIVDEANAMTLATSNKQGIPSARIVLLKGYDENGFVFFTNYNSHKGKELAENPHACLLFFWKELERQVRIQGTVEKISEDESDKYFKSRPYESKLGAWSSPQSTIIESRDIVEQNFFNNRQRFDEDHITRPAHWGGYIVKPTVIEFWQGRPSRLHDRIQYTFVSENKWKIERLAP